ncbi:TonB-linked outer membrane protein, SusC/RagA family [Galbibacter orientalis DSM 19592]|uniref:TonB-linked outer membrane protein, SusC/RagA family n=1 Tax=Galbibacter orientalis DSM 19592 TaxID=926559 RepID=I3C7H9_9FLAO|nr:SusC/RagA family TonB-linked outer membrane protein [Galbibacter orientalis]EIJ39572.1 TonB-linked outer membrane protein, SusC/RagA family [Galbibacter orientalis DSM 19592]
MNKHYLTFLSVLLLIINFAMAQERTISGIVISEDDNQPLPGANVLFKGTTIGAVTDFDGKFSITISGEEKILVVSYIGYSSKEITIALDQNTIEVYLNSNSNALEEVVVMGSSVSQSRKKIGNAITTLKSKDITSSPTPSVTAAIQGKIPGAQITQNSGDPAGGFSIRLRGPSTISGSSEPLYVIDGVITSNLTTNVTNLNVDAGAAQPGQNRMADINPNDIASINILNGSAAAAIYGSRASNGVVIINTKQGLMGNEEPEFYFKTSVNVNTVRKKVPTNLRGEQFESGLGERLWPIFGKDENGNLTPYQNLSSEKFDVTRYDYQDLIFDTGYGTDNYLSMRGGAPNIGYNASVGYTTNQGIIKNTDFKRLSTRLGFNHKVTDWLSYDVGAYFANSQSNEKPDGNVFWSPINSVNISNNIYDATRRDENGNLMAVEPTRVNPLSIIEDFDISQEINRFIPNLKVAIKPFDFLTINQTYGADMYTQVGHIYIPAYPYPDVNPSYFDKGYLSDTEAKIFNWNYDATATFDFDFSDELSSETIIGYNFQSSKLTLNGTQGRDLNANNIPTVPLEDKLSEDRLDIFGFFLQESLAYKDRYFLTVAGRVDGATNFAPDNRTNFYPKISGSYLLSNEPFWENSNLSNIFNSVRLRSSYGHAGNLTAISPYERFGSYSRNNFFGVQNTLVQDSRLGNLDLKPERTKEFEIGTDVNMFNNRVSFLFTYYNQNISDLIVRRVLSPSEGGLTRTENVGNMKNHGYEAYLNVSPIKNEDWQWDLNFNFSTNKNEVTNTSGGPISIATVSGALPQVREGEPLGVFYGTYYAQNTDGSLLLTPDGLPQTERGNITTGLPQRDANGQPVGDQLKKVIGDPNADYILAFGTNLTYKKLSFSMLWESVQGFDVFDADKRTRQGVGVGKMAEQELTGELPRGYIASIYPIEEFRIEDGSFIKLREISLSYKLGSLGNALNNVLISVQGRNLFSFDDFFSYDPETNAGGQSNLLRSVNFGNAPIPRTFSLSVSANF